MGPMRRRSVSVLAITTIAVLALAAPAEAGARDTDHDGMPNRWERAHGLDWRTANARGDVDHDGISNIREFRLGLDPRHDDSAPACSPLQVALGADDPSECGSLSLTEVLR